MPAATRSPHHTVLAVALAVVGIAGLSVAVWCGWFARLPPESALRLVNGTLTSFIKLDRRLETWNHYEVVVNPERSRPILLRFQRSELDESRLAGLVLRKVSALYDPLDNVLYALSAEGASVLDGAAVRRGRDRTRLLLALAGGLVALASLLGALALQRRIPVPRQRRSSSG